MEPDIQDKGTWFEQNKKYLMYAIIGVLVIILAMDDKLARKMIPRMG